MNPAAIALVVAGGRGDRARLVGMVAGVMVGVALFLLLWGAYQALQTKEERGAWLQLGGASSRHAADIEGGPDPAAVVARTGDDHFEGAVITRVDVAAPMAGTAAGTGTDQGTSMSTTAGSVPQIPGLAELPPVGSYAASPALARLIASAPADQLSDRYGERIGILSPAALPGPDALVAVVGTERDAIVASPDALQVASFTGEAYGGNANYRTVALVGGIALLLPVLLLVAIVTDLGAAQRRDRLSTLRLLGATRGDLARIAAAETGATTLVGALAGVALARLLVPLAAQLRIDGVRFFATDLIASPVTAVVAVAGAVGTSTLVAVVRARRFDPGAPGAARESAEAAPRVRRLVPVIAGLAVMVATTAASLSSITVPRIDLLLIGGFVLTSVGLLVAGPYLTWLVTRGAAARARSASGLIAMSRISRSPRSTFRSVGGLVLAVFMVSVFAGAASTALGEQEVVVGDRRLPPSVLIASLEQPTTASPEAITPTEEARGGYTLAAARSAVSPLSRVAGVEHVAIGAWAVDSAGGLLIDRDDARGLGLTLPAGDSPLLELAPGAQANDPALLSPSAATGARQAAVVLVTTDGTEGSVERARTALDTSGLHLWSHPLTRAENVDGSVQLMVESFARMANVGMGIATLVAAASLTVATMAGVLDRRRSFGLLRLTGMPMSVVRRVLMREAAVPLTAVTLGTVALGFVVAWTILAGLTAGTRTVSWPDPSYLGVLAASLLLAVASVVTTFGAAERSTAGESTRFE